MSQTSLPTWIHSRKYPQYRGPDQNIIINEIDSEGRNHSLQTKSESIPFHNQTGSDARKRMLGDEGEQQEEDCYYGDEDASRDPRSVETGSYAKRSNSTPMTPFNNRRGYARGRLRWFGDVQRRDANDVTRRVMNLAIPDTRRRGRPKKTCHQQMQ